MAGTTGSRPSSWHTSWGLRRHMASSSPPRRRHPPPSRPPGSDPHPNRRALQQGQDDALMICKPLGDHSELDTTCHATTCAERVEGIHLLVQVLTRIPLPVKCKK